MALGEFSDSFVVMGVPVRAGESFVFWSPAFRTYYSATCTARALW